MSDDSYWRSVWTPPALKTFQLTYCIYNWCLRTVRSGHFGYEVVPDVVDTILGTAHGIFVIFEDFEKQLFEETGHSLGSFHFIDIGPIVSHRKATKR